MLVDRGREKMILLRWLLYMYIGSIDIARSLESGS